MTADDWTEICDWYEDRYRHSQYTAEDAVAIFADLKQFDASDVWSAVFRLHEQGREFPPNASVLLARTIDERAKSAREDMYRGTPEARGTPLPQPEPIEWSEYVVKRFGEKLSWNDAIARIHAQMRPCNTKTCDLHYKEKVGAE